MPLKKIAVLPAAVAGLVLALTAYQYFAARSQAHAAPIAVDGSPTHSNPLNEVSDMRPWLERARDFAKPDNKTLKGRLTPLQYQVTQRDATERAFDNSYWDNKQAGIYVDVVSGEPLFSSLHKYKSGTGWPSFTRPISEGALTLHKDRKLFFTRTELRSVLADSHLGHVFDDGPAPVGLRYCINSAALRFIPKGELEKEGYGELLALFDDGAATRAEAAPASSEGTGTDASETL